MNIVFVSSEVAPFAKTGGMGDVCGSLPPELSRQGRQVAVITPAYRQSWSAGVPLRDMGLQIDVPVANRIVSGTLLESRLPNSDVPTYLINQPNYFDRPGVYGERGEDYKDNCERFVFFSRAALEAIRLLRLPVDVVHCHDWQTGLVPAYLQVEYRHNRIYQHIASIFTVHNLAYQGVFWHWDMLLTGLDWKYFNWHQMEFHGQLNLMKTGLTFADALTTVSPTYAEEIQLPEQGCGLNGVLRHRQADLRGIVNGVDYGVWDPAIDSLIPRNYSIGDWTSGKAICKTALRHELGLPDQPKVPLIGAVGRLADQKGWDLLMPVIRAWASSEPVQWVILGTGQKPYHEQLTQLAAEFPGKLAVRLTFDEGLAHRIEAASDMFVMPSRFEPCGLNQLYSLRYGAVPVVRATGGLVDTVVDATPDNLHRQLATGFVFESYDAPSLEQALHRACQTYWDDRVTWEQIVCTGMRQDWSWARSAHQYVACYEQAIERRRHG